MAAGHTGCLHIVGDEIIATSCAGHSGRSCAPYREDSRLGSGAGDRRTRREPSGTYRIVPNARTFRQVHFGGSSTTRPISDCNSPARGRRCRTRSASCDRFRLSVPVTYRYSVERSHSLRGGSFRMCSRGRCSGSTSFASKLLCANPCSRRCGCHSTAPAGNRTRSSLRWCLFTRAKCVSNRTRKQTLDSVGFRSWSTVARRRAIADWCFDRNGASLSIARNLSRPLSHSKRRRSAKFKCSAIASKHFVLGIH
jgi:hypothetical protein